MLWPQGNCAATCCTIGSSGQASANARMYFRFRGEKSRHFGERAAQVGGEAVDDLRAPALLALAAEDVAPDLQ